MMPLCSVCMHIKAKEPPFEQRDPSEIINDSLRSSSTPSEQFLCYKIELLVFLVIFNSVAIFLGILHFISLQALQIYLFTHSIGFIWLCSFTYLSIKKNEWKLKNQKSCDYSTASFFSVTDLCRLENCANLWYIKNAQVPCVLHNARISCFYYSSSKAYETCFRSPIIVNITCYEVQILASYSLWIYFSHQNDLRVDCIDLHWATAVAWMWILHFSEEAVLTWRIELTWSARIYYWTPISNTM